MRAAFLAAILSTPGFAAGAEMREEEHLVGDTVVRIAVVDTIEILTAGPSDGDPVQILSGADVDIVLFAGDADSVAAIGRPVVVVEVTGTHSCDEGDARGYWVVELGNVPTPHGPVTTCEALVPSLTSGHVVLEADPMADGAFWAWAPGQGWSDRID